MPFLSNSAIKFIAISYLLFTVNDNYVHTINPCTVIINSLFSVNGKIFICFFVVCNILKVKVRDTLCTILNKYYGA